MSEEKMYVVKNNEGKYWDFYNSGFWRRDSIDCIATPIKKQAGLLAIANDGHVVTLVEEPEKVVLTKEQAKVIEETYGSYLPATRIADNTRSDEEEDLMMKAYVNGYTVKKEKKYNVKVPQNWSGDDKHYWSKEQDGSLTWACLINKDYMIPTYQFTTEEIKKYHLDGLEKVEVEENGGLDK